VWPVAFYGSESWTLKANSTKLKAFETYCDRKDPRINESVLNEIGADGEFVATIYIKKQKLQYFGHMTTAQKLRTHCFECLLNDTKSRGRPRRRWSDDIKNWTRKTLAECTTTVRDRKSWRELVCRSVVSDLQK